MTTKLIYFLRHAEAEPNAASDRERRLTAKGWEQAGKVGEFCKNNGIQPELILSSPVIRAKQTAKVAAEHLGHGDLVEEHWLACGMSAEVFFREISAYEKMSSVMVVGHEPDFSGVISSALGLPDPDAIRIRKASLTAVEMTAFRPGAGQLQFSIPARLM